MSFGFGVKVRIENGEAYCECKFPLPMKKETGRRIGHTEDYAFFRCGWCGSVSELTPVDRC